MANRKPRTDARLRTLLRQARRHIIALRTELEFTINMDESGVPGEPAHPIQTARRRKVTAARRFLEKLEDV